jgi:hypothetical protein
MGSIVVKPERYEDLYIIWSSIVEAPTYWGSRSELVREGPLWLKMEYFDRADACSSSSQIFPESWEEDWGLIFMQSGFIRRSRMKALVEVMESRPDDGLDYEDPRVLALLEPLD